jgi:uncharacterized damage-inducible protein DinB
MHVAEAMPEKKYNTKPTDGVWNFGELMHHIAYGIAWWKDNYVKGVSTELNPPAAKTNKKQVIDYLNQSYDDLKATISNGKLNDAAIKGFYATLDHVTHHRGQAVYICAARTLRHRNTLIEHFEHYSNLNN